MQGSRVGGEGAAARPTSCLVLVRRRSFACGVHVGWKMCCKHAARQAGASSIGAHGLLERLSEGLGGGSPQPLAELSAG